ncbi:hypothetical protein NWP17_13085 [Chrysosporum bergii ANA360D]|jgi:chromosome segregation ATPase|uniref:Uncharacterized protein n=1 Tax=Chrysosporum bergii ANA360D TaxID=617107 RepID=A0AA43GTF2_9CYAN|nr:hypothetical protein [Chrysosporum bergii]MDH6061358.1 hypothetical protein [Chrysosporum bergii ANA360D]
MVNQHNISELLPQEPQKLIPLENQAAIEITAEEVKEQNLPTPPAKATLLKDMSNQDKLQSTVEELKQTLQQSQEKEKILQQQITDLQSALYEEQILTERLTKELHEVKKTALNLAEANSKLIEESNSSVPGNQKKPTTSEKTHRSAIQVQEKYNPVGYKKSHRIPEHLIEPKKEDDISADNTWLLD